MIHLSNITSKGSTMARGGQEINLNNKLHYNSKFRSDVYFSILKIGGMFIELFLKYH